MRLLVLRLAPMFAIVHNRATWQEAEVVVRLDADDVWEDAAALEREVLENENDVIIRVLDARNGNIAGHWLSSIHSR